MKAIMMLKIEMMSDESSVKSSKFSLISVTSERFISNQLWLSYSNDNRMDETWSLNIYLFTSQSPKMERHLI